MLSRSLVGGGDKAGIAATAAAASGDYILLADLSEIEELVTGIIVVNDRTYGHCQLNGSPVVTLAVAAFAVAAALGLVLRVKAVTEQGVFVFAGDEGDIAAAAAIATAGTTAGYVLLTPERETAVAAVAGFYQNFYFIDKHKGTTKKKAANPIRISGRFKSTLLN
jgi:hypothetical protein